MTLRKSVILIIWYFSTACLLSFGGMNYFLLRCTLYLIFILAIFFKLCLCFHTIILHKSIKNLVRNYWSTTNNLSSKNAFFFYYY